MTIFTFPLFMSEEYSGESLTMAEAKDSHLFEWKSLFVWTGIFIKSLGLVHPLIAFIGAGE